MQRDTGQSTKPKTLKQRFLELFKTPGDSGAASFEEWQHEFMYTRLILAIALWLFYQLSFLPFDLYRLFFHPQTLNNFWLTLLLTRTGFLLSFLFLLKSPYGRRHLGLVFLCVLLCITLTFQVFKSLEGEAFNNFFMWMTPFFCQAIVVPVRWKLHLLAQVIVIGYYFGVNGILLKLDVLLPPNNLGQMFLFLFWYCLVCDLSVFMYERLARAEFQARHRLTAEQEKSERLLLNILPQSIADRLKQEHRTIADSFAEVTVLFADIVGFTALSARIPPQELVELLNQVFSAFDQLAAKHDLEKIKTIGDAYMAVAGLPQHRNDHAQAIANMALDMQEALRHLNQQTGRSLNIRIGIHTGPVVAGVIGLRKFAYDLWGDTVNTASRMESYGIPGEIQVSRTTYECLRQDYWLEERGVISVRGKGEMTTFLLKGKQRQPATVG